MKITRLAHINIGSTDLAASERFYCEILGLSKAFEFHKEGSLYGFYVNVGETTFIEIFIQEDGVIAPQSLLRHLCLEVDDLDAVIADVRAKGWEISDKKRGCDQSWQCWITDPSGVPIEIMQYTPESSQFTGAPCEVTW